MRPLTGRLGQPFEALFGGGSQQFGIAAGIAHEMAGKAFGILDQRLQQVLGEKILMAAGKGLHLRRLQDAAGAFGQIREVQFWHSVLISRP